MVDKVLRNRVKSVRIADYCINMSNRLLAFLNLMLICAFNSTTVQSATFLALQSLVIVGAIYFLLNFLLSRVLQLIERRFALSD